eukprot:scaffold18539_cov29-Tisochrysis_lutea.AAC.1
MQVYHPTDRPEQPWVVATSGDVAGREGVLVRLHDACLTSEILRSIKCDCEAQLRLSQRLLAREGGVLIYTPQEGRGIGLAKKVAAYQLQYEKHLDTVDANRALGEPDDARSYTCVPAILRNLGIRSICLLTNNPFKATSLKALGVDVVGCRPLWTPDVSDLCRSYVNAKVERMGHMLPPDAAPLVPATAPAATTPASMWRSASDALNALRRRRAPESPPVKPDQSSRDPLTTMRECAPCLPPDASEDSGARSTGLNDTPDEVQQISPQSSSAMIVEALAPTRPFSAVPNGYQPPSAAAAETRLFSDLSAAMAAHRRTQGVTLPFVTVSYAQGLDGSMCGPLGAHGPRLMLSGSGSMTLTHKLRATHDAVLIGVGTLLADNPRLTVRLVDGPSPLRVVVDSQLRTPLDCQLLTTKVRRRVGSLGRSNLESECGTVIITLRQTVDSENGIRRSEKLRERGAIVLAVNSAPTTSGIADLAQRVCLRSALGALRSELGVTSVMVEGGVRLLSSLLEQHVANFMAVTVAPVFAGGLRPYTSDSFDLGASPSDAEGTAQSCSPSTARATAAMAKVSTFAIDDDVVIAGICARNNVKPQSRL